MAKDHKKGLEGTVPNIYPGLEIVSVPARLKKSHNSPDVE